VSALVPAAVIALMAQAECARTLTYAIDLGVTECGRATIDVTEQGAQSHAWHVRLLDRERYADAREGRSSHASLRLAFVGATINRAARTEELAATARDEARRARRPDRKAMATQTADSLLAEAEALRTFAASIGAVWPAEVTP
jgi:hypothetical protein